MWKNVLSIDGVVATSLCVALIGSLFIGDNELVNMLTSGLLGFLSRNVLDKSAGGKGE